MDQETKFCNYCGKQIKMAAIKCRYCGKWLAPRPDSGFQQTTFPGANTSYPPRSFSHDAQQLRQNASQAYSQAMSNPHVQAVSGKLAGLSPRNAALLFCGSGLLIVVLFLLLPMWQLGGFGSVAGYKCLTEDNLGSMYPLLPILFMAAVAASIAWVYLKKSVNWIISCAGALLGIFTIVAVPMIPIHLTGYLVIILCLAWGALSILFKNRILTF